MFYATIISHSHSHSLISLIKRRVHTNMPSIPFQRSRSNPFKSTVRIPFMHSSVVSLSVSRERPFCPGWYRSGPHLLPPTKRAPKRKKIKKQLQVLDFCVSLAQSKSVHGPKPIIYFFLFQWHVQIKSPATFMKMEEGIPHLWMNFSFTFLI